MNDRVFAMRICTELICWPDDHFDLVSLFSQSPWFNVCWSDRMWRCKVSLAFQIPTSFVKLAQPCSVQFSSAALFKTTKPSLNLWGASLAKLEHFWIRLTLLMSWNERVRVLLVLYFFFSLFTVSPKEKVSLYSQCLAPINNLHHLQRLFLDLLLSLKCPNPQRMQWPAERI